MKPSLLQLAREAGVATPDELHRDRVARVRSFRNSETPAPIADVVAAYVAGIPKVDVSRVAHLERLERELAALLSLSAPHLWAQIRAPLRRLLNRARHELRAADRGDLPLLHEDC